MGRLTRKLVAVPLAAVLGVAGAVAVAGDSGASGRSVSVVGYSTISSAYAALETAFEATTAGQGVTFTNSFGASGTQAQDVVAGLPADIVNLSLVPDLNTIVKAGLVSKKWASNPASAAEGGFVADSTVVFVTRQGNPLDISGWNSLTQSGVQIVTPDPISSGSAKWNLLGAYESQILKGKTPRAARTFLGALISHVVAEPSSGSKALSTFLEGTGNVLLAYESDAQEALAAGSPISIVYPTVNILIQTPAALTNAGLTNPAAVAFFKFIFSYAGQKIFAGQHYRATLAGKTASLNSAFYQPSKMDTIASLGGWSKVWAQFFSASGFVTRAEHAHGYTT